MKIVVFGSTKGTDLQCIIDASKTNTNIQIVCVISNKKDAFILERAKNHSIETFHIDYLKCGTREEAEKILIQKLKELRVDLILLIGWMKIFTNVFVKEFQNRIWNIHPSLLPKYSGGMDLNVHSKVLQNHEKESGCSLHQVTEEVDGGRIILQKKTLISEDETPETLKEKVQKLEQECLLEGIQMVLDGLLLIG